MMNRAELWEIVQDLEIGGQPAINAAIYRLKSLGAVSGIHVGVPPENFNEEMMVEWYAGQGLEMLEGDYLIGINSWINCLEKFVPLGPIA